MKPAESIYLDAVRFLAALLVVSYHSYVVGPGVLPFGEYGHDAVVIFFVLSGYVISYVTAEKENSFSVYAVSRLSRIYSVVLPALLLTVICDAIGRHGAGAAAYHDVASDHPLVRLGAAVTFTAELWFLSIQPFSDGPMWSLCYEVWYYLIFAAACFLPKGRRLAGVCLLCLVCGPKILVMMPIWIAGALLYRRDPSRHLPIPAAALLFPASLAGLAALLGGNLHGFIQQKTVALIGEAWNHYLEFSKSFLFDYLTAALVCCNFVAVRALSRIVPVPRLIGEPIRLAAGLTFSIYLYHLPLLRMFTSVLSGHLQGRTLHVMVIAATALVIVALGIATEFRRPALKRRLTKFLGPALTANSPLFRLARRA